MRQWVAGGLATGLIAGAGIATVWAESAIDSSVPEEKKAEIAAAEGQSLKEALADLESEEAHAWLDPVTDSGVANDLAHIKKSVQWALQAEIDAGVMPATVTERKGKKAQRGKAISDLVEAEWAPSARAGRKKELTEAVEEAAADPTYPSYTQGKFVLEEWQGVTVGDDSATAVLLGHKEFFRSEGGWVTGPQGQFQVTLTRTGKGPKGWGIVDLVSLYTAEGRG